MKDNSIGDLVYDGLKTTGGFDLATDYAEIGLDMIFDNEVVKEIPFVKTIIGIAKGGIWVRERHFVKKMLVFFEHYHKGNLPEDKRLAFIEKMKNDVKYKEKVVDHITIFIDRFVEHEKSEILANLLLAHLNEKFDWKCFRLLSICLDNLNLQGVPLIEAMSKKEKPYYEGDLSPTTDEAVLTSSGAAIRWGTHYQISTIGVYLHIYGIKGDIDFDINTLQRFGVLTS